MSASILKNSSKNIPGSESTESALTAAEGKLSQREFLTTLAVLKAMPVLVALSVATVAALVAAALFDLRWGIVALMIILIIAPGVMSFLYITYALSPRCIPVVHEHQVRLLPDSLYIIYKIIYKVKPPEPAAALQEESQEELQEETHKAASEKPSEETASEPEERIVTLRIPREDIAKVKPGLTHLLIEFRHPFGFLKIAYTRLSAPDLFLKNLR